MQKIIFRSTFMWVCDFDVGVYFMWLHILCTCVFYVAVYLMWLCILCTCVFYVGVYFMWLCILCGCVIFLFERFASIFLKSVYFPPSSPPTICVWTFLFWNISQPFCKCQLFSYVNSSKALLSDGL